MKIIQVGFNDYVRVPHGETKVNRMSLDKENRFSNASVDMIEETPLGIRVTKFHNEVIHRTLYGWPMVGDVRYEPEAPPSKPEPKMELKK